MRSIPRAIPPCGGAPIARASRRKPNFVRWSFGAHREEVEHLRLDVGLMDPEGAAAELVAVHNQVIRIRKGVAGIVGERLLPLLDRPCERMVLGCPTPLVLVPLEHREVGHPEERERVVGDQAEVIAQLEPQCAEDSGRHRAVICRKEERLTGGGCEGVQLLR